MKFVVDGHSREVYKQIVRYNSKEVVQIVNAQVKYYLTTNHDGIMLCNDSGVIIMSYSSQTGIATIDCITFNGAVIAGHLLIALFEKNGKG